MQRTNSSDNTTQRTLALPAVRVQGAGGFLHVTAEL